jgi:hypothetical protein
MELRILGSIHDARTNDQHDPGAANGRVIDPAESPARRSGAQLTDKAEMPL